MTGQVDVDTTDLEAAARKLMSGLTVQSRTVATAQAQTVAAKLRAKIPVRTGRLRGTVRVTSDMDSATVHYGGALPYANKINLRTRATASATAGCEQSFVAAMRAAAALEVRKL